VRGIDSCPTPTPPFIRCNPLRNRLGILFIPLIFFSGYLNDDIYCCCFFAPPSLLKKKLRCTKKNLNFGEISNAIVFFSPALLLHRPYVSMAIFIVFYFHPPQCYFLQNPLPPTPRPASLGLMCDFCIAGSKRPLYKNLKTVCVNANRVTQYKEYELLHFLNAPNGSSLAKNTL